MTAPDPERPRSEREALATLLPCPWCGELPDVRQRKRGRPIRYFTEVICTNMPDCPVLASVSDREEAVAIAAWNRRAGWRRDGGEAAIERDAFQNQCINLKRERAVLRAEIATLRDGGEDTARPEVLAARIGEYLSLGGLFNPELMDHDKVRDLLIDCRGRLTQQAAALADAQGDVEIVEWMEANVCRMTRRFADGSEHDMEWDSNGPDADTLRSTVDAALSAGRPIPTEET